MSIFFIIEFSKSLEKDKNSEIKNQMYVVIQIENITQKICAKTVIIKMVELKDHGYVDMISYMHMDFAKIVILINIIKTKMYFF